MSRAIGLSAAALPVTRRPMRLVGGARRCLASAFIPGVPRKLEEIVKLELLAATEPDRLLHVWAGYHADQPELAGAAAEAEEFNLIVKRGTESPRFIWPVRRDGGHFLLFSQYAPAHLMFAFTFLDDYRRSPGLAPPWLSVLLYGELLPTKGVALLRAEADTDRLTKAETEALLASVRRFYGTEEYDNVWAFNHFQKRFVLDKYLKSV